MLHSNERLVSCIVPTYANQPAKGHVAKSSSIGTTAGAGRPENIGSYLARQTTPHSRLAAK